MRKYLPSIVKQQASEIQNETANRIRRPAQVRQPGQYNTGFNNQNFSRNSSSSSARSRGISAPTRARFDPDASSDRYSARQRNRDEDASSPVDSPIRRKGPNLGDGRGDTASRDRDVDIDVENNINNHFSFLTLSIFISNPKNKYEAILSDINDDKKRNSNHLLFKIKLVNRKTKAILFLLLISDSIKIKINNHKNTNVVDIIKL